MHYGHIVKEFECHALEFGFHSLSKEEPFRVFQARARQDLSCVLERQLGGCETQAEMS